jgi:DNA-binding GntR family transcriptional regulator
MHNYKFKTNTNLTLPCPLRAKSHRLHPMADLATAPPDSARAASPSATPASGGGMLAPTALYEQVAERLRQQIFARELEPGSWIDELKLCAQWGISRTPMREALKVLAVEGLVTMKVRRGAYVTEMSRDDVAQVYHLLALLESDAAAQVAASATSSQRARLSELHALLEAQVDHRDAFFATNEQFHMALLDMAGNRWAVQVVQDLRKMMKLNRHHSLFKQGRLEDSLAEHRALIQALSKRDAEAARQTMQAHFRSGLEAAAG